MRSSIVQPSKVLAPQTDTKHTPKIIGLSPTKVLRKSQVKMNKFKLDFDPDRPADTINQAVIIEDIEVNGMR